MKRNGILLVLLLLLISLAAAAQAREASFKIIGVKHNVSFNISGFEGEPYQTGAERVAVSGRVYMESGHRADMTNNASVQVAINETVGNVSVLDAAVIVRKEFAIFNLTDYRTRQVVHDNRLWLIGYDNIAAQNKSSLYSVVARNKSGPLVIAATKISGREAGIVRVFNNSTAFNYTFGTLKISDKL